MKFEPYFYLHLLIRLYPLPCQCPSESKVPPFPSPGVSFPTPSLLFVSLAPRDVPRGEVQSPAPHSTPVSRSWHCDMGRGRGRGGGLAQGRQTLADFAKIF